jgi:hypothetical protein
VSKHKEDCVQLLEQIKKLLDAIMILHINTDASGELPIDVLNHVGKFTEYLFWSVCNPPYTDQGYQDPSQNLHICGGPTKGQQSEKLLPPGGN